MKLRLSYYHYVQCDATHVRSLYSYISLHFWAGAALTRLLHVDQVSACVWADCKSQKAEDERKVIQLSKETVLEKSVSLKSSDFSVKPIGTSI